MEYIVRDRELFKTSSLQNNGLSTRLKKSEAFIYLVSKKPQAAEQISQSFNLDSKGS